MEYGYMKSSRTYKGRHDARMRKALHRDIGLRTAAISGSKGSSGLGLLSFSWMVRRTTGTEEGSSQHVRTRRT